MLFDFAQGKLQAGRPLDAAIRPAEMMREFGHTHGLRSHRRAVGRPALQILDCADNSNRANLQNLSGLRLDRDLAERSPEVNV